MEVGVAWDSSHEDAEFLSASMRGPLRVGALPARLPGAPGIAGSTCRLGFAEERPEEPIYVDSRNGTWL